MRRIEQRILTSWIQDISSKPAMGRRWPVTDFDESLLEDYCSFIDFAREWGYNGIVAWGLFVGHDWPVEIEKCLTPERRNLVKKLFEYAKKRGVALYTGLGVYSWGFENIIRANPSLSQGEYVKSWGRMTKNHGDVMCYHQDEARAWMRRIIDYIVYEVDSPAFQLQPFDKGRCMCEKCAKMNDAEYFSALIYETADYIKTKWPDKLVGVSGWGMRYDSFDDIPYVKKMAQRVDYISDVTNSCRDQGSDFRKAFIKEIPCAFGDSAGGSVTPPQTWEKLRWFFPHIRYNADSIRFSAEDGARAIEVFGEPIKNPSCRVTLVALSEIMKDPSVTNEQAAKTASKAVYGLSDDQAEKMGSVLLSIEESYFQNISPNHQGDVLFERLDAVYPSPPIYLLKANNDALSVYRKDLVTAKTEIEAIRLQAADENSPMNTQAFADSLYAIENVLNEIDYILLGSWQGV